MAADETTPLSPTDEVVGEPSEPPPQGNL